MKRLKVGQKLWWIDRDKMIEGYVIVADITKDEIIVWHNGKPVGRPHSVIGKKLFLSPQLCKQKEAFTKPVKMKYASICPRKRYSNNRISTQDKIARFENCFVDSIRIVEKSCDSCRLRKNGNCTSLQNKLCEDYIAVQNISEDEKNSFPQYGDATAIRKRDRKHFE